MQQWPAFSFAGSWQPQALCNVGISGKPAPHSRACALTCCSRKVPVLPGRAAPHQCGPRASIQAACGAASSVANSAAPAGGIRHPALLGDSAVERARRPRRPAQPLARRRRRGDAARDHERIRAPSCTARRRAQPSAPSLRAAQSGLSAALRNATSAGGFEGGEQGRRDH